MLKIRRSCDRLIFNMGISYLGKTVFLLRRGPGARQVQYYNISTGLTPLCTYSGIYFLSVETRCSHTIFFITDTCPPKMAWFPSPHKHVTAALTILVLKPGYSRITKSMQHMILGHQPCYWSCSIKRDLVFHEEQFQLATSFQCWVILKGHQSWYCSWSIIRRPCLPQGRRMFSHTNSARQWSTVLTLIPSLQSGKARSGLQPSLISVTQSTSTAGRNS